MLIDFVPLPCGLTCAANDPACDPGSPANTHIRKMVDVVCRVPLKLALSIFAPLQGLLLDVRSILPVPQKHTGDCSPLPSPIRRALNPNPPFFFGGRRAWTACPSRGFHQASK